MFEAGFRFLVLICLVLTLGPSGPAAVLSIAHRGNSLFAPENTLAAFAAAEGVADLVETDARLSADGKIVLVHDSTVDRTTDGTGPVASQTLAQLKLLDAGSWFGPGFAGQRIPTLEEMLTNTLPYAMPLIEHKDGTASAYVAELRRLAAITNVVVQSFDWNFLAGVKALEPAMRLGALGSGALTSTVLANITNAGASIVAWEKSGITTNEVSLVHRAGLVLFVWTVDGAEIRSYLDLGVDGIISNDPGMVRQLQQAMTNGPARFQEDLVAYWALDDGLMDPFAATVADRHGTNSATLTRNDGASHWFDSPLAHLGGCLKLEGTNAFVTMPRTSGLDINTNAITFSAWVRLTALPSQSVTSYGAIYDSTTDCYVLYLDKANRELRFKITDANGHAARPGIPEAWLRTNEWLHVAATFSGSVGPSSGQATIYLNGQPRDVHTGHDGSAPIGLTGNVKTGQTAAMGREGPTGGNYFTGYIDDVAIWRRALSASEVRALYESGQNGLSLGDLLAQPTPLIQFTGLRFLSAGQLEIKFTSSNAWPRFRLLEAGTCYGPFLPVAGLAPEALGGGSYRFLYRANTNSQM